jgi:hypothetical protein
MSTEPFKAQLRLTFQCSIPFDDPLHAEEWYRMLREMVMEQSPLSTLNGQVMKMLEPCCGDRKFPRLQTGVPNIGPPIVR